VFANSSNGGGPNQELADSQRRVTKRGLRTPEEIPRLEEVFRATTFIESSMRAGLVRLAAVALSVASCTSATEPLANVSAAVIPETVVRNVESSSGRVDVSLSFSITNPTTGSIYYSHCSPSLERKVDDRNWELVASKICFTIGPANLLLDGTLMIPAGESREVGAFMSGDYKNGVPSTVPAGTYRVRFAVLYRNPVAWRGAVGTQYKSTVLTTREFAISASN
jgi:hypothetical protein